MTAYALLVGINAYRKPLAPLRGALNDIECADRLATRIVGPGGLRVLQLRNKEATKAVVVDAFRTRLGLAGPGDSALFWFSGHARRPEFRITLGISNRLQHIGSAGDDGTLPGHARGSRIGETLDRGDVHRGDGGAVSGHEFDAVRFSTH